MLPSCSCRLSASAWKYQRAQSLQSYHLAAGQEQDCRVLHSHKRRKHCLEATARSARQVPHRVSLYALLLKLQQLQQRPVQRRLQQGLRRKAPTQRRQQLRGAEHLHEEVQEAGTGSWWIDRGPPGSSVSVNELPYDVA